MSKLTKEEEALLKELRAYKRMSKAKRLNQDIHNRIEQSYWDAQSSAFKLCFDNGIGVSGLQLDE